MTTADERLVCAWCGKPLSAVEVTLHVSARYRERVGWHPDCYDKDTLPHELTWTGVRVTIESRGPGRVGTIGDEEHSQ